LADGLLTIQSIAGIACAVYLLLTDVRLHFTDLAHLALGGGGGDGEIKDRFDSQQRNIGLKLPSSEDAGGGESCLQHPPATPNQQVSPLSE